MPCLHEGLICELMLAQPSYFGWRAPFRGSSADLTLPFTCLSNADGSIPRASAPPSKKRVGWLAAPSATAVSLILLGLVAGVALVGKTVRKSCTFSAHDPPHSASTLSPLSGLRDPPCYGNHPSSQPCKPRHIRGDPSWGNDQHSYIAIASSHFLLRCSRTPPGKIALPSPNQASATPTSRLQPLTRRQSLRIHRLGRSAGPCRS